MVSARTSDIHQARGSGWISSAENQYRSDAFVLAAVTFISYLALAWQFTGPTYQMDEIGYLSNAATFSGRSIDAASSYYFGYSLFLLPGFLLFHEPVTIWKSVLVTNSLLFAISIFLLHRISGLLSKDRWLRFSAVLLCALYPAYPTMAGYSFSTAGFVLVFVAACWAICQSGVAPKVMLPVFALLIGFLNWVHPTGLPVAVAAVMTLGVMAWFDRKLIPAAAVSSLIIVLMILAFREFLNPLLLDVMTPEGFRPRLHYPSASDEFKKLVTPDAPLEFLTRVLAQIGYVLIASLTLAAGGAVYILGRVIGGRSRGDSAHRTGLLVFALLSVLGVAVLTALVFTKFVSFFDNQYWIFGRFLDGVLLPLLLVSFLFRAPRYHQFIVTLVTLALLIGLLLIHWPESGFVNEIVLPAFWPQVAFPKQFIIAWFLAGGVVCLVAVFLPMTLVKFGLAGLFVFCITNQVAWHHQSFRVNGSPSDLYRYVRDTTVSGGCVAIQSADRRAIGNRNYERFNLLSFYLMNYEYRRMETADWIDNCDGPFLTYDDNSALERAGAVLVARELDTGLKVYARNMTGKVSHETYSRLFVRSGGDGQPVSFSARVNAVDLIGQIGRGALVDGAVVTTGTGGHVIYGPYGFLNAGKLRVSVYGQASNVDGSWFEVVSNGGNRVHGKFPLQLSGADSDLIATGEMELPEDLHDFELRLNVSSDAVIAFSHYDLEASMD